MSSDAFEEVADYPFTNRTTVVEAVQMWEVRWLSRCHRLDVDGRPELECFTSESEAEEFAKALRAALSLLRYSQDKADSPDFTKVTVSKAKSV